MAIHRNYSSPLIVFDAEFVSEVPMMISDDPEVKRIFRPGISMDKLGVETCIKKK